MVGPYFLEKLERRKEKVMLKILKLIVLEGKYNMMLGSLRTTKLGLVLLRVGSVTKM